MKINDRVWLIFIGVVLIGAVALTLLIRFSASQPTPVQLSEQASSTLAATYTSVSGAPVSVLSTDVAYTIVLYWASWCPQCAELLPAFLSMAHAQASSSLRLLAVNRAEPRVTVESYLQYLTIPTSDPALVLDVTDTLFLNTGGSTMPEVVVYDTTFDVTTRLREPTVSDIQKLVEILDSELPSAEAE